MSTNPLPQMACGNKNKAGEWTFHDKYISEFHRHWCFCARCFIDLYGMKWNISIFWKMVLNLPYEDRIFSNFPFWVNTCLFLRKKHPPDSIDLQYISREVLKCFPNQLIIWFVNGGRFASDLQNWYKNQQGKYQGKQAGTQPGSSIGGFTVPHVQALGQQYWFCDRSALVSKAWLFFGFWHSVVSQGWRRGLFGHNVAGPCLFDTGFLRPDEWKYLAARSFYLKLVAGREKWDVLIGRG